MYNYSEKQRQSRANNGLQPSSDEVEAHPTQAQFVPDLFFAQQIATNSCSTHALVSILLNISDSLHVDIGQELTDAKSFLLALPPEDRGQSLQSMESLRVAHNSFTKFFYFLFQKLIFFLLF